jgi:hypothetical protein
MKNLKYISGGASILAVTAIFVLAAFFLGKSLTPVSATVEACFCHNINNNPETICTDNEGLINGHMGHVETDFDTLGACTGTPTPTPTPSSSSSPTPTPTPTPTPEQCEEDCEPTSTPTPTPTPTPGDGDICSTIDGVQTSIPDGWFQLPDSTICRQFQFGGPPPPPEAGSQVLGASTGQVLGASTMAGAGSFDSALYQVIMGLGGIITSFGLKNVLRKSN